MNIKDKSKIKNDTRWKYLVDKETWEVEEIQYFETKYISIRKKPFMRIFDNKALKKEIYDNLWDYVKYILLLTDYVDYENTINFNLFQFDYGVSDVLLSKIRKRLQEHAIIVKDSKIWYMNPVVACKWQEVSPKLWNLFQEKNKTIYSITSL